MTKWKIVQSWIDKRLSRTSFICISNKSEAFEDVGVRVGLIIAVARMEVGGNKDVFWKQCSIRERHGLHGCSCHSDCEIHVSQKSWLEGSARTVEHEMQSLRLSQKAVNLLHLVQ